MKRIKGSGDSKPKLIKNSHSEWQSLHMHYVIEFSKEIFCQAIHIDERCTTKFVKT